MTWMTSATLKSTHSTQVGVGGGGYPAGATQAETLDTVAKLDMLINKVLQVASEKEERRMQAANNRPSRPRPLWDSRQALRF